MPSAATKKNTEQVTKYADMFSAMGTEARLQDFLNASLTQDTRHTSIIAEI